MRRAGGMLCRLPRSRRIPAIACAPSPRYRSDSSSSTSSSSSCAPLADVFAASVAETSRVPITRVAHEIWRRQRREPGDDYVDLTVGHAKDTVVLARMANEGEGGGRVFGFDIQNIDNASANLKSELSPSEYGSVELHEMCHSLIQDVLPPAPESRVAIVVGNLGYLPGAESDKTVKTQPETTIVALRQAAALLRPGGM